MPKPKLKRTKLYDKKGAPKSQFNRSIKAWLDGSEVLVEHKTPAAFDGLRDAYLETVREVTEKSTLPRRDAHKLALSNLTSLMFGHDLAAELEQRLNPDLINVGGFRTTLSQGVAKNVGENFVNVIVYALAELLENNDDILVDKGLPPALKRSLTLKRKVDLANGTKKIHIPIEGDFSIYSRANPLKAIVVSAKTRLKEVFHIGTMWKLFFDMIGDDHCLDKWNLETEAGACMDEVLYIFATADMVNSGGRKSQGPDVEREEPRNLIAMDASFFDYVMVSKSGIGHVSGSLSIAGKKESLFHELGCIIDLVEQKFEIKL